MATTAREDRGVLDSLESALIRAIKGAAWLPVVYIPRQFGWLFRFAFKLLRIGGLAAAWVAFVGGPLVFLGEVRDPLIGFGIVGWTLMGLIGSIVGVLRVRKSVAPPRARADKPADLAEAFV